MLVNRISADHAQNQLANLLEAIRKGMLTPSQMEDVVYAMHSAYVDHHEDICTQLPTNLEDVADTMVLARKNTERFGWEVDDETPSRLVNFHSVEAFLFERVL